MVCRWCSGSCLSISIHTCCCENVVLSNRLCVHCLDNISSGAVCATCAGWSCWRVVRIAPRSQGYPFFPSVWVLNGCLVKLSVRALSKVLQFSKEILLYELCSLFTAIELMRWLLDEESMSGGCFGAPGCIKHMFLWQSWEGEHSKSSVTGAPVESFVTLTENEMNPYVISRHRASKMTVIPTYTFNCWTAVFLPEKTSVLLATALIDCDLGRKVTEPTANVEQLKKSSDSFYMEMIQFTTRKNVPWAQSGFSMMQRRRQLCQKGCRPFLTALSFLPLSSVGTI